MKPVKVGVIGYGQIGPTHIRSYEKISDLVKVEAVAETDSTRAQLAQKNHNIPTVFSEYEKMCQMDALDVIDVCIPTHEHAKAVMTAAKYGKHVFCEKPMAMSIEDTDRMYEACEKAGVKLQLGFVRRYDNQWLRFADVVREGKLGRPVVWRSASAGAGAPNPWFFQKDEGGGPFVDGAVHNYDFGHYMFGKACCVTASGVALQPSRSAPDTGVIQVHYESGDRLQMMWSWGLKKGMRAGGLHDCLGENGALLFEAPKDVSNDPNVGHMSIVRENGEIEAVEYKKNEMFTDQMKSFVECVIHDTPPVVTASHGKEALKVALAVLEAFETNKTVCL